MYTPELDQASGTTQGSVETANYILVGGRDYSRPRIPCCQKIRVLLKRLEAVLKGQSSQFKGAPPGQVATM